MNKSLSYVNLSFDLHVAETFSLGSNISGTISLHFAQPHMTLKTFFLSCSLEETPAFPMDKRLPAM